MTKRKEKETGMNKATQTGPRLFREPTIPLMRGTSAQTVPACPPCYSCWEHALGQDTWCSFTESWNGFGWKD